MTPETANIIIEEIMEDPLFERARQAAAGLLGKDEIYRMEESEKNIALLLIKLTRILRDQKEFKSHDTNKHHH